MSIPNTTPTPNELYNGEMKKMGDTELRIVLVVTRATLGWEIDKNTGMRKKEDWISYWQLKQKTGRGHTAIAQAIDRCVKMGWIETRDDKGNLLETKNKRIGKRIFYRLGRIFLDKLTSPESGEVGLTSPESGIPESGAYKRNIIHIQKNAADAACAPKKINPKTDPTPMGLEEFVVWCKRSPNRHMHLIGDYADEKKILYTTKGQWNVFISRHTRAASQLAAFNDDQIDEAMSRLKNAQRDYLGRWTLETLLRYSVPDR